MKHHHPSREDYSDLKAVFFNGTLKRSPQTSNTEGLIDVSRLIMEKQGVTTRVIRTVDHDIASGVYPDMREHGWETDEWPELYPAVAGGGHRGGRRAHLAGGQLLADQETH